MTNNTNQTDNSAYSYDRSNSKKVHSVSEAKKLESGHIKVTGMIATISTLYKAISKSEWRCDNPQCSQYGGESYTPPRLLPQQELDNTTGFKIKCPKCFSTAFCVVHTFHNARSIQLEDFDKTEDTNNVADRLEVMLYDDASDSVTPGEEVDIEGDLYVQRKLDSGKAKKLVAVLHSNKIKYKNRKQIVVTPSDVQIFHRHKKICAAAYKKELEAVSRNEPWSKKIRPMTYVDRVVAMFAPNVIGQNDKKLGLLRSIVGGRADHGNDNGRRGRINTLLVGDKGTAKSILGREAAKILPNSRDVTAQNATGKSLLGIVDKENDSLVLRLGPVVLAKNAVCSINEINALSMEDQQPLLDIKEEGRCTFDKYGLHIKIDAPTTIVATANPYGGEWDKKSGNIQITKEQIPILRTSLDRDDQVYAFVDAPSEKEIVEYATQKTHIRKRRQHNYNFLKKLLIYMKNNILPDLTFDAEYRLNQFWIKAKVEGTVGNRTYDSIFRLSEAQARLSLSNEVDDDIATQTMHSMSIMLSQYGKLLETIESPRDITYRAFYYILKRIGSGISVAELCKIACEENILIHHYLGNRLEMEHNHKIKPVIDILLNSRRKNIKIIKSKPMVLQYIEDTSDATDIYDTVKQNQEKNSNKEDGPLSDTSDTSDTSDKYHNLSAIDVSPLIENHVQNQEKKGEENISTQHQVSTSENGQNFAQKTAVVGNGGSRDTSLSTSSQVVDKINLVVVEEQTKHAHDVIEHREKRNNNYDYDGNSSTTDEELMAEAFQRINNTSQASHPSPLIVEKEQAKTHSDTDRQSNDQISSPMSIDDIVAISETIYRIHQRSDIFACYICKRRGDKWDMQKHICKGAGRF